MPWLKLAQRALAVEQDGIGVTGAARDRQLTSHAVGTHIKVRE